MSKGKIVIKMNTNKIKIGFFAIVILLLGACASTQKKSMPNPTTNPQPFPQSWAGNWVGTLDIHNAKGKVQSVPMEVEIKKIDTSSNRYTFALIYGEDKVKGRRPYEMIIKDPEKGLYVNDEKNSIQMEEYLINNRLFCWFEVEKTLLLSIFEKKDDNTLIFEIISGSAIPVSTTGGQKIDGEDVPPVKTYPIKATQRAILKKIIKN
jgi:hypothetical protein